MPGVRFAAESPAPSYVIAPPAAPAHAIDRPEALERLDHAVAMHRVVLVVAPAGYGKTALLSSWCEQTLRTVGWLSLTPFDKHPQQLERGLVTALEPILGTGADDLTDLLRRSVDDATLVIDDVHLIGTEAAGVLGMLLDRAPAGLRIVLATRRRPLLRLQRLNAAGGLGELSAHQLAFSAGEIRLAADRLDRPVSDDQVTRLLALTGGWPVAVRLALMSDPGSTARLASGGQFPLASLTDYLIEEVLGDLPTVLRDFLLRVSVCDWLTGRLATELSGDAMAPAMLDDAISRGLPLERQGSIRGEPVYRWHPLLADQCRTLLRRRDPEQADDLHARAARYLASANPALAARHALAGRAPGLASEIVIGHWLSSVLRGDLAVLEEVCLQLPAPWSEHPDILSIRATCRSATEDAVGTSQLRQRARLLAEEAEPPIRERHEVTELLSDLLVADDSEELISTCRRVRVVLTETTALRGTERACAWFLVGFAEVRLRRTHTAVPALREAAALGHAEGLDDIAGRAHANLVFALAFNGDFAAAQRLLDQFPGDDQARWRRTEGRPEWFASAWMSFWRDDLDHARQMFARCIESGGAMTSFATMSRIWTASIAATTGDPADLGTAEAGLAAVEEATVQCLPLNIYKGIARAQLALADRQPETAAAILDTILPGAVDIPSTLVFAAETYLACDRVDAARACLTELQVVDTLPSYVAVAATTVEALVAERDQRIEDAHELLEQALALASQGRVLRPLVRADPHLRMLLTSHAHRGTAHEEILATALSRIAAHSPRIEVPGERLSSREREVLSYMQTGLSSTEIAEALFISANTLKTHQRAIYRKLGVSSRREAARTARDLLGGNR